MSTSDTPETDAAMFVIYDGRDPTAPVVRYDFAQRLERERNELRGLTPELPPRPDEGHGLPRYGLRWNGPNAPLSVPMGDGYWTPWHLAERLRARVAELEAIRALVLSETSEDDEGFMHREPREALLVLRSAAKCGIAFPVYTAPPDVDVDKISDDRIQSGSETYFAECSRLGVTGEQSTDVYRRCMRAALRAIFANGGGK